MSTVFILLGVFVVLTLFRCIRVVQQKTAVIVERLGKYNRTLTAGLHFLVPFLDRVAYIHTLKEQAIDVPAQVCITNDNIQVEVDGILYLQVLDPEKASYGIENYLFASIQLAQTTMRSVMGKLVLDKTFEERDTVNTQIIAVVDAASDPWGVKVTRYEVKNINPPASIKEAMEKEMKAVREKRAVIAESEGVKQKKINEAEGEKTAAVARSEGEKQKRINEAEGKAKEIESIAAATAEGINKIAEAVNKDGGKDAVNLRIAEQYIGEFGKLAKASNTLVIPSNLSDISGMVASLTKTIQGVQKS